MAAIKLTVGTIEIVPVDVTDRSGATTDLSAASPTFTVLDDLDVALYDEEATTATVMRIDCLLDTTATHPSGAWDAGHYRLFVSFTVGSETPRLGPIDLYLIDE
jgi:hypothetical protein